MHYAWVVPMRSIGMVFWKRASAPCKSPEQFVRPQWMHLHSPSLQHSHKLKLHVSLSMTCQLDTTCATLQKSDGIGGCKTGLAQAVFLASRYRLQETVTLCECEELLAYLARCP